MTAAVERGWSTFLFGSKELSKDWSSTARIHPLFIDGLEILDEGNQKVAAISVISSPSELQLMQPENIEVQNTVIDFRGDWQVIPAENIVAAFQGCPGTVLAVSKNSTEAQVFLEALEQGLDGVVLKVEDMDDIIKLKDYFDRRNEAKSQLQLTKATVSKVEVVGMGDRVCVDLCSIMRPGEGLMCPRHAYSGWRRHNAAELRTDPLLQLCKSNSLRRAYSWRRCHRSAARHSASTAEEHHQCVRQRAERNLMRLSARGTRTAVGGATTRRSCARIPSSNCANRTV